MQNLIKNLPRDRPVLIAGPTASGKSAIALEIVAAQGGVIVNADALQVFDNWQVLTARPGPPELAQAQHRLYGHVDRTIPYSVGQWLREVVPLLAGPERPVIVGGTGLYFSALTEGLVDIPQTPRNIRSAGDAHRTSGEIAAMLAELDPATASRIDRANPMRVQRAWEVQQTTGRGLADWQDNTPPAALPLGCAETILLEVDRDVLAGRIEHRFDAMLANGALDEVRANLATWDPALPSSRAIGAADLIACLRGDLSLEAARDSVIIATRQFAKRQRTWFRSRMKDWNRVQI